MPVESRILVLQGFEPGSGVITVRGSSYAPTPPRLAVEGVQITIAPSERQESFRYAELFKKHFNHINCRNYVFKFNRRFCYVLERERQRDPEDDNLCKFPFTSKDIKIAYLLLRTSNCVVGEFLAAIQENGGFIGGELTADPTNNRKTLPVTPPNDFGIV